jgi:hypothetical protein
MTSSQSLLPAPVVSLASGNSLDPDLVGAYLDIEVPTSAYLIPFARCTMRITGRSLQGTDIEWENEDQLSDGLSGESLWFYCAKNVVEELRGCAATFSYAIVSPASEDPADMPAQSAGLTLIVGELVALPPPEIADLVRDIVDSTLPRLLVTVPASGASLSNAMVTVTLRTDTPALFQELSQVLDLRPPVSARDVTQETKRILDNLKPLPFTLRGYPATHDDQEVDASYEIVSPDGTVTSVSESTIFRIGTPLGLNEPLIEEAEGEVLDIDSFVGDAHITTEPSERIQEGLFYWAYMASEGDGEPIFYPVKLDSQVTQDEADGGLRIPIAREILNLLPTASTLRVQIAINLTGTDDPFDTVDFPEKTYTVALAEEVTWDLDDLNPAQIPPIHVGQTMSFPLMDIVFVTAKVAPETNRIAVEEFAYSSPGYYSGVVLYIGGPTGTGTDNVVRIEFKRRWAKVRFALTSVDAPVLITWHTASGQTVQQTIPGGSPTVGHEAKCEMEGITAVVIEPKDGIRLDCFEFQS